MNSGSDELRTLLPNRFAINSFVLLRLITIKSAKISNSLDRTNLHNHTKTDRLKSCYLLTLNLLVSATLYTIQIVKRVSSILMHKFVSKPCSYIKAVSSVSAVARRSVVWGFLVVSLTLFDFKQATHTEIV